MLSLKNKFIYLFKFSTTKNNNALKNSFVIMLTLLEITF